MAVLYETLALGVPNRVAMALYYLQIGVEVVLL